MCVAESKAEVLRLGAVPLLIQALSHTDLDTVRSAMKTVSVLSSSRTLSPPWSVVGSRVGRMGVRTNRECVTLTSVFCYRIAENRVAIRELGGIAPIIGCLMSQDVETTRNAAAALINLSVNGTHSLIPMCVWYTVGSLTDVCVVIRCVQPRTRSKCGGTVASSPSWTA